MISSDSVGLLFKIKGDSSHGKKAIKEFRNLTESELRAIEGSTKSLSGAFNSFIGNVAANAVTALTSKIVESGKAVLDYSARIEQLNVSYSSLLGNSQDAASLLDKIRQLSLSTPFAFEDLASLGQRLLATNVEMEKIPRLIKDIGNIVAGTGALTEERLQGVNTAISQVISKGKVQAEEMEQLAERGLPAWQILSQALGKSISETRKLAEDGKISADIMIDALQKVSQERFGDAMEKQSNTFSGAMNKIENIVMMTASTAFAPLYTEISKLATEAAKEIESQGNDFEAIGETIGRYVVAGMTSVIGAGISGLTSLLKRNIESQFTGKPETFFMLKFSEILTEGIAKGLGFDLDILGKNAIGGLNASLEGTAAAVDKTKSLADQLEGDKATKEAEKLQKKLKDISVDLATQILFFGDVSEEAAAKQKLLSAGVSDFDTAQSKAILGMAKTLDKLKEAEKLQKEYNDRIKEYRTEINRFVDTAFDSMFPSQNELDRFNKWVNKTKADMGELSKEVAFTRDFLKQALGYKQLLDAQTRSANIDKQFEDIAKGIENADKKLTPFQNQLLDIARSLNLVTDKFKTLDSVGGKTKTPFDITDEDFAVEAELFLKRIQERNEEFIRLGNEIKAIKSKGFLDIVDENELQYLQRRQESLAGHFRTSVDNYKKYLSQLKTIDAEGKEVPLFQSTAQVESFIDQLFNLEKVVQKSTLTQGLKDFNSIFKDLGVSIGDLGTGTYLDDLNEKLSSPEITAAINERAKALGITAEQLREIIRLSAEGQNQKSDTRERVVGVPEEKKFDFFEQFSIGVSQYLLDVALVINANNELEFSWSKTFSTMKDLAVDAFAQLASGFGSMVANWILYGSQGENSMRKMVASVLANISQIATTYAILCLAAAALSATGFGALVTQGTPAQFLAAAALFGAVAVGTALAGRAVAGDSFQRETRGGFGSSNSVVTQASSEAKKDRTITEDRLQRQEQANRVDVVMTIPSGMVEKRVIDNINNLGEIRTLIIKTAEL